MLINEKTKQVLKIMKFSGSKVYLLTGEKGVGRMTYVRQAAAEFFNTTTALLQDHPDYYEIHSEKPVGINDLSGLREFAEYMPASMACKVAVIDAISLTEEAQASLLKLLEDGAGYIVFILILGGSVLDTIKSRSCEIPFFPVESCKMDTLEGSPVVKTLAFGRPGVFYYLSQPEHASFIQACEQSVQAVLSQDRLKILASLHLIKEKDKESFFDRYGKTYAALWMRYLTECISQEVAAKDCSNKESLLKIADILRRERIFMENSGSYSKNDFFDMICYICENC